MSEAKSGREEINLAIVNNLNTWHQQRLLVTSQKKGKYRHAAEKHDNYLQCLSSRRVHRSSSCSSCYDRQASVAVANIIHARLTMEFSAMSQPSIRKSCLAFQAVAAWPSGRLPSTGCPYGLA